MTRTFSWIPTALLTLLAAGGVWLIVAPFTVGHQLQGADWALHTRTTFISGAVLLAVCLVTLAGSLGTALRTRIRAVAADENTAGAGGEQR